MSELSHDLHLLHDVPGDVLLLLKVQLPDPYDGTPEPGGLTGGSVAPALP